MYSSGKDLNNDRKLQEYQFLDDFLFFILNIGAIESTDIEGKIEKPCQVQSVKKIYFTRQSKREVSVALSFKSVLKPIIEKCEPLVTSMLLPLLGGHRDANSALFCRQTFKKHVTQMI